MKFHNILRFSTRSFAALVLCTMFACQSLEFSDPNNADPSNASIQSLVTGIEGGMRIGVNFQTYGLSSLGREAYSLDNSDPRWLTEYISGQLDPGGPYVGNHWGPRYRVMTSAKLLLDRAALLPAVDKARVEGFANTIIGYELMMLAQTFAKNGVNIQFPSAQAPVPLATQQEAMAEAARRLDAAYTALQSAGSVFLDPNSPYSFALSRGFDGLNTPKAFAQFNRGLRARLAAWQGDYATVLSALQQSFIKADADAMNLGGYLVYGTGPGDVTNPIYELPTANVVKFWAHPAYSKDNSDAATDKRVTGKVSAEGARTPYTLSSYTATRMVTLYKSNTDPIPLLRNEELLLLRAEANIRGASPNINSAREDLNLIRKAAGVAAYTDQTFTSQNALDRLLYERRYSLFAEGHRWIDMRRFNRLNQLPNDQPGDVIPDAFPVPIVDKGSSN